MRLRFVIHFQTFRGPITNTVGKCVIHKNQSNVISIYNVAPLKHLHWQNSCIDFCICVKHFTNLKLFNFEISFMKISIFY